MGYQLKRSERIEEVIGLGDTGETISINLNVSDIARDFNARYNAIIRAEQQMKNFKSDGDPAAVSAIMETYGNAVVSLFELLFGKEGSDKILKFYESDYVEMTLEVFPFITEVVVPQIKRFAEGQKQRLRQRYKGR